MKIMREYPDSHGKIVSRPAHAGVINAMSGELSPQRAITLVIATSEVAAAAAEARGAGRRHPAASASARDMRPVAQQLVEISDRLRQTVAQRDLRLPAQLFFRPRDIGLALPWIIRRQRHIHDV